MRKSDKMGDQIDQLENEIQIPFHLENYKNTGDRDIEIKENSDYSERRRETIGERVFNLYDEMKEKESSSHKLFVKKENLENLIEKFNHQGL